MALFDELHGRGNTIVLVTHEPDIAEYAHRIVHIKDGKIFSDQPSGRARRPAAVCKGRAVQGRGSSRTEEELMASVAKVPLELYLHTSDYDPDAEYVDGEIEERPDG